MTGSGPTGPAPAVVDGVDIDAVVAAVRGCPGVDDLSSGLWGGVTSYLPGRQVSGVRIADDTVTVSVRARWNQPRTALTNEITGALRGLVGSRRIDIQIVDITDVDRKFVWKTTRSPFFQRWFQRWF